MNIYQELVDQRNQYWETHQILQKKYQWNDDDARLGIFAKCMNNFEPIIFSLDFERIYLRTPEFQARYSKDHKTPPTEEERKNICEHYIRFIQTAYADLFFASIESSFRIFVRSIDPIVCDNATSNFQSVYAYLLKQTGQQKYQELLDLWRMIRNTQHNNGVYMDAKRSHVVITYDGKTYQFDNEKVVLFVDVELLLKLSREAREMIQLIVESKPLSSISIMVDPVFHIPRP